MTTVVQTLAIIALAPLLQGCMKTVRARLSGRPGPSPLQASRDFAKLWGKEALLPDGVSVLALIAPGVALGVATTFAAALPFVDTLASSVIDVVALAKGHILRARPASGQRRLRPPPGTGLEHGTDV